MNKWNRFRTAVHFGVPFLVVCVVATVVSGRNLSGIVLMLIGLVMLLGVWAKFLNEKGRALLPWKWDGAELAGLAGLGAGVLVVGGIMVLCGTHDAHMKPGGAQTTILAVQTLVLAITAGFVVWYASAAQRQATNSEWTAGTQLLRRSVLFVTDPIKTVGEYKKKSSDLDKVVRADGSHIPDDWLMIEITNEGGETAMNVKAWARWHQPGFGDAEARPRDTMRPLCKCGEFNGKENNLWREWRLPAGESRLFYFRPPCKRRDCDATKKERTLKLRWYDVVGAQWTWDILVFQSEEDGNWYTAWWGGPELHYHKMYMSLPEPPERE